MKFYKKIQIHLKNGAQKIILLAAAITTVCIVAIIICLPILKPDPFMGGTQQSLAICSPESIPTIMRSNATISERYQRPSKLLPLDNPYTFDLISGIQQLPPIKKPKQLIYIYYGILKEASNMIGYSGGCGTIGDAGLPYPYAYQLLTTQAQAEMTLKQFEKSFIGTGHTTLLQIHPMPADIPDSKKYAIELEVITGKKESEKGGNQNSSFFAYYLVEVTMKKENGGWKIDKTEYYPEDFLCAPYHNWFYDSQPVVQYRYLEQLKIIDEIKDEKIKNGMIYIYGAKGEQQYRFDFMRLTNGHDILLQINRKEGEHWVAVTVNEGKFATPEN